MEDKDMERTHDAKPKNLVESVNASEMIKTPTLIRRCSICKTIIMPDGVLVPKRDYDEAQLVKEGYSFSDGYLSERCVIAWVNSQKNISEELRSNLIENIAKRATYKECAN